MINWININSGFCMFIITVIYVIATVFICIYNGRSAKASKKQLSQNVALQLYDKRKTVLENLRQMKLEESFYDVKLLFDNDIFEAYMRLCEDNDKRGQAISLIEEFKENIRALFSEDEFEKFEQLESLAEETNEYANLYKVAKQYVVTKKSDVLEKTTTIDYAEQSKLLIALQQDMQYTLLQLYHKIEDFIKSSIAI